VGNKTAGETQTDRPLQDDHALLSQWAFELTAGGARPRDVYNHQRGVQIFVTWLSSIGSSLAAVDEPLVWAFQGYLLEKPHQRYDRQRTRATVAADMYRLRRFGDWLAQRGYWSCNHVRAVAIVKSPENPPLGLLKEDALGSFLDALMQWDRDTDVRNQMWAYRVHVMAEVQYATGLRMSELAALTEADLDLERFEVRVRNGKGGKDRVCYLTIWAADILRLYLSMRVLVIKGGAERNPYVFGPKGSSVCRAYNKRLNTVAHELGFGRWYNHQFRHALGYHLLRAGCPLRSIQSILGHDCMRSTELYTKVDAEDLRGVLDTCHPRSL